MIVTRVIQIVLWVFVSTMYYITIKEEVRSCRRGEGIWVTKKERGEDQ